RDHPAIKECLGYDSTDIFAFEVIDPGISAVRNAVEDGFAVGVEDRHLEREPARDLRLGGHDSRGQRGRDREGFEDGHVTRSFVMPREVGAVDGSASSSLWPRVRVLLLCAKHLFIAANVTFSGSPKGRALGRPGPPRWSK